MSNRICGRCKSTVVVPWHNVKDFYKCMNCSAMGHAEKFPEKTVFHQITASEALLAEEFVEPYTSWGEDRHLETLWRSNFRELSGMLFDTEEEAIATTLAKLKEVYNERQIKVPAGSKTGAGMANI